MKSHQFVTLEHGAGGLASEKLLHEIFLPAFGNSCLNKLGDQAILPFPESRLAFTTDSYVIDPIFFPGGDIGSLAIYGTINDLAVGGATPKFLSLGLILEEGLPFQDLMRIAQSISKAARECKVEIVTGDTKVVPRGSADKIFINTSGIGYVPDDRTLRPENIIPGDKVLVSGTLGDHGIAILTKRKGLSFEVSLQSDSAPLHTLVQTMLHAEPGIKMMRDPTRGGLASSLNEIAKASETGILLQEKALPITKEVRSVCEILGLDPLHVANEGKLVAFVPANAAEKVLAAMKGHSLGQNAAIIGTVVAENPGQVEMKTQFLGSRIVEMLTGEQLPRIC